MPTQAEFEALTNSTNAYWTWKAGWTGLGTTGGGYLVRSEVNYLWIFIPAAGSYGDGALSYLGETGSYWSSTNTGAAATANYLGFTSSNKNVTYTNRYYGFPIRPVKD